MLTKLIGPKQAGDKKYQRRYIGQRKIRQVQFKIILVKTALTAADFVKEVAPLYKKTKKQKTKAISWMF